MATNTDISVGKPQNLIRTDNLQTRNRVQPAGTGAKAPQAAKPIQDKVTISAQASRAQQPVKSEPVTPNKKAPNAAESNTAVANPPKNQVNRVIG